MDQHERRTALDEWKANIERRLQIAQDEIKALEDERTHALKWGVITLGTGVIALCGWIVELIAGIHR